MQVCSRPTSTVSLRHLLPGAAWSGPEDIGVTACACDSRKVEPGSLFVALPGSTSDGHDFIAEAVARGCSAILSERPAAEFGLPNCVTADARDAYGRICQALAGNPSYQLKLIGVTGTNGKTTTSCLIASVLSGAGHRVGMLGTLGYFDGEELAPASLTTPPAERPGRLVGPHGPQRLHARGDGSFQPRVEPVAGGRGSLRCRLRDERQPRPPRLPSDDCRLPVGQVEAVWALVARRASPW